MNYVTGPCPVCRRVEELTYFAAGVGVCSKQCFNDWWKDRALVQAQAAIKQGQRDVAEIYVSLAEGKRVENHH